jgi:ribulose-phosphate 3-epimerase
VSGRSELRLGAALFNADHAHLADALRHIEDAGLDFIHLDVFDGHFVPDLGFPPRTIAALRPLTDLPFEVHLGAVDPLRYVPHHAEAGVNRVIIHVESLTLVYESVFAARESGVEVGLALTLGSPLTQIEPAVPFIDAVLLLSRVTGEGVRGASFNPLVLPRVEAARRYIDAGPNHVDLEVAGGVNRQHIPALVTAGADAVGLGAGLYKVADMAREVADLRALALRGV